MPGPLLSALLLCLAAAAAGPAGRGRLVRSEAPLGTVSAVVRADGAVAGRGRAAAGGPKAEDAELAEEPGAEDPYDAELAEDWGVQEMLAEEGLEGLAGSAFGAAPMCAKRDGDNCTCQGIMAVGSPGYRAYIRIDGTEPCANPNDRRRRTSRFSMRRRTSCLCYSMDVCANVSKANNKTIDAVHRRRTAPPDTLRRRRSSKPGKEDERGTGLAQRRRWCGLGGPDLRDCEWGDWGSWSECQAEEEGKPNGVSLRTRPMTVLASGGGKQCEGDDEDMVSCRAKVVPAPRRRRYRYR